VLLEEWPPKRQFRVAARARTFLTGLHRLFVSGSGTGPRKGRDDYRIEGPEAIQLQHLYRARTGS